ncbi:universal stress protein [Alicyclobacillus shizuokensis]|uniref:universal stress protein n=1 Tax=Alicyclobacillus shizuokensis TaxID=392014 RepID=UPI00082E18DB|nr:universal stress protein [Alicyclobacillus shizuokensis]
MRVMWAVSGRDLSAQAVRTVENMLRTSPDTELIILHVSQGHASFYQRSNLGSTLHLSEPEREIVEALQRLVHQHFSHWPGRVRFRHEMGVPSQVIVKAAREEAVDLVILGRHGRALAERVPVGRVARAVLQHLDVDVLLVR